MKAAEISIEDLPLRYEVGDSVVEQFALSHSPTDILRELVQNEYDAGGNELGVYFGKERLVITGNGNPIDVAGWERLRVMLGTGWVQNLDTYVDPKESSIGSKNLGLRSLFTVGDVIWVFSGANGLYSTVRKGHYILLGKTSILHGVGFVSKCPTVIQSWAHSNHSHVRGEAHGWRRWVIRSRRR